MRTSAWAFCVFYFFTICLFTDPGNIFAQTQNSTAQATDEVSTAVGGKTQINVEEAKHLLQAIKTEKVLAEKAKDQAERAVSEIDRMRNNLIGYITTISTIIGVVATVFIFIVSFYLNSIKKGIVENRRKAQESADISEKAKKSIEEVEKAASRSQHLLDNAAATAASLEEHKKTVALVWEKLKANLKIGDISIDEKLLKEVRQAAVFSVSCADAILATVAEDWNDAYVLWHRVVRANPDDDIALAFLSKAQYEIARKGQGSSPSINNDTITSSTESSPASSDGWNVKAYELYHQSKVAKDSTEEERLLREAWEAVSRAQEIDENNVQALFNTYDIGNSLLNYVRYSKDSIEIEKRIRNSALRLTSIKQDDLEAWVILGDAYMYKLHVYENTDVNDLLNALAAYKRAKDLSASLSGAGSKEYCICLSRISQCYYELSYECDRVKNLEQAKEASREGTALQPNSARRWGEYAYQTALLAAYTKTNNENYYSFEEAAGYAANKSYGIIKSGQKYIDEPAIAYLDLSTLKSDPEAKKYFIQNALDIRKQIFEDNSNPVAQLRYANILFEFAQTLDANDAAKYTNLDEAERYVRQVNGNEISSLRDEILGKILLVKGLAARKNNGLDAEQLLAESLKCLKDAKTKKRGSFASYYLACYYMLIDGNPEASKKELVDGLSNRAIPSPAFLMNDLMAQPFRETSWYQSIIDMAWENTPCD